MKTEFTNILETIECELKKALPLTPDTEWKKSSFGTTYENLQKNDFSSLTAPCRHLIDLGGKRWRPLLLILCAKTASESLDKSGQELSLKKAYSLVPLVEFIHTASLIHDDIEDSSDMRRGKPATHIVYGLDTSLNAGSWLYFQASQCIDAYNGSDHIKNELYRLYGKYIRQLHLGQAMDITWHRNLDIYPSTAQYMTMVRNKTGTLAALAAHAGILAGGGSPQDASETADIAADIGAGFQILDDVINLTTGNPGKKRGDDIVEGKKSLPVLYFIEMSNTSYSSQTEKKNALQSCFSTAKQEGINSPAVETAIEIMETSGAIERAANMARLQIEESCKKLIDKYSENESVKLINSLFTEMLPERSTHA